MKRSPFERVLLFFARQRALALALFAAVCVLGFAVIPFDVTSTGSWAEDLPRSPVHVDAIPDTGANQQVVFAGWPGQAAEDVELYVTYPLSSELLALSGVRTVRSTSATGFCALYVVFEDESDFFEARTRLTEKLASLADDLLPTGVHPRLGPDATGLGQVFWYVLEAQHASGDVAAGAFDLHELRAIQDDTVRPALASVPGVAEVSSIGGHVAEWQVEVDLPRLSALGLDPGDVRRAVRRSHLDTSGGRLDDNGAEYVLRGRGRLLSPEDLESALVREEGGILLRDVARIVLGPAPRRGLYDLDGHDAVGGVVVVRYGENPREVLDGVRARIAELAPSLPSREVRGGGARITVRPIYDRSELIDDTVATLGTALQEQLLISALVLMLMLGTLRGALVAAAIPPLGVLVAFMAMWACGIEANAMSLAGIAIAIGSMIDIGIVFVESAHRAPASEDSQERTKGLVASLAQVAPATLTSALTTAISFLPVFALGAGAGRLFRPLAFTKTFALLGALLVAFVLVAPAARTFMRAERSLSIRARIIFSAPLLCVLLYVHRESPPQMVLLGLGVGILVTLFVLFERSYARVLSFALRHRRLFLVLPLALLAAGVISATRLEQDGRTPFNEGSFLFMPSAPAHASIASVQRLLRESDAAIAAIPEVRAVLGKAGRVDSALDPAPLSMFETMVFYHPEFAIIDGERVRQWRDHIRSPADIWDEVARAGARPGLTPAPMLQPIETRQIMLQSGMRGPIGVRLQASNSGLSNETSSEALTRAAAQVETMLRGHEAVRPGSIQSEQSARVPYLDIELRREALARHGLHADEVLRTFASVTAGTLEGEVFEGRTRRAIRVRAERSGRQSIAAIEAIPLRGGLLRLGQVADVVYASGPAAIRSEDTLETRYVLFSAGFDADAGEGRMLRPGEAATRLEDALAALDLPEGVRASLAGSFIEEEQSAKELRVLVPIAFALVFLLVFLQFRSLTSSVTVFSGAFLAVAGGLCVLVAQGAFAGGSASLGPAALVGFIALVGIAVDDGVLMMTFLRDAPPDDFERIVFAAGKRVRACLMTTATTLLALLPVLLASGRGADLMTPMAWPLFGGMAFELLTLLVVPVLYSLRSPNKPT
ncbi:MAG: efflux RND transporter permease subunit [Polyangiales bacterium]